MCSVIVVDSGMRELIYSGYIDNFAWLVNYTSVSKIKHSFMDYTLFGFNPITQWRYLSVTKSLYSPGMVNFRHSFGTDATLVLSSQGFYIALLLISVLCFTFLQFVIYLAPYEFESTSTPLLICTLVNFVIFFVGSHFYGRWAGQLQPNHYSQGRWKNDSLPIANCFLLVFLLLSILALSAGAWVLFEYLITQWESINQFEEYFIKGLFAGFQFIVLKISLESIADTICEEDLRESHRRSVKLLNYYKLFGGAVVIAGYPIYYLWAKLFIEELDSVRVESEFRYWIYGYAAIIFGIRPLCLVIIF